MEQMVFRSVACRSVAVKSMGVPCFRRQPFCFRKGYGHILQISPSHLSEQVASHTGLSAEAQPTHFTYTRHTHTPLHPICSIANSVQSVTPSPRPHHRTPLVSATMIGASPSQAETCLTSHANHPTRFASFAFSTSFHSVICFFPHLRCLTLLYNGEQCFTPFAFLVVVRTNAPLLCASVRAASLLCF